ncbi:MAG TPA: dihydropteroate synthase [Geminicoccaceae bacterium]|nr:dihydropteroate synthase [Geminicoccaceae bacterium]
MATIYLRPLGVIAGPAANDAIAAGFALPLAGGPAAFTGCEVWRRGPEDTARLVLPATDLAAWLERQPEPLRAEGAQFLDRLLAAPAWPDGLPRRRPLIMGVVNVTPDSFSDGGQFVTPEAAIAHGLRLREEGADIVDVGGESTRPGAAPVSAEEELERVIPVIEALVGHGVPVSIDTRKAAVMRAALAAGAGVINDVSALRHDPEALPVAGTAGVPVVLMHSQGEPATMQVQPTYDIAPLDVFDHLAARVEAWTEAGFERSRLLIDPGIGFGKTLAHNLEILGRLGLYLGMGLPILLGVSRKSFIGRLADGVPAPERMPGSLAAALAGVAAGIAALRVHDVAATQQALAVWQAIERQDIT